MQKTSPEGIFEKSPKLKEVTKKLVKIQKIKNPFFLQIFNS